MAEILQQEQLHGDSLVAVVVVVNMIPTLVLAAVVVEDLVVQQQTPIMVQDLVVTRMVTLILGVMLNQLLVVAVALEDM